MKRSFKFAAFAFAGALAVTSCSKKQGCMDPLALNFDVEAEKDCCCAYAPFTTSNNVVKSGDITSDETWTADYIYELAGKVVVHDGATLTINAGTVIKGRTGTGSLASALVIAKGGKIMANGTASDPIIFTSTIDNIVQGQMSGTNLDETDNEKWGGLIILGNAPVSTENGDASGQIEGIPAEETYGQYGGSDVADDSGVLRYVSIRHGGALIGEGNEINGLTLGGVGNGTTIEYVEVVANLDDGIECFGGTVNIDNALVAFQGDDGIDLDQNYSGTINNFMVIHGTNTDEALEIDGPEGSTHTTGLFTLSNGTIISTDGVGTGADLKSKAQGTLSNVTWEGYTSKVLKIRASFSDTTNWILKDDAYTHLINVSPTLTITGSEIVGTQSMTDAVDVYTKSADVDNGTASLEATAEAAVGATIVGTATGGADRSQFNGWTWASNNGKL